MFMYKLTIARFLLVAVNFSLKVFIFMSVSYVWHMFFLHIPFRLPFISFKVYSHLSVDV